MWRVLLLLVGGCGANNKSVDSDTGTDPSSAGDDDDDTAPGEPYYGLLAEDLPGALFSVWGSDRDNVWMVGVADASGPQVLHFDGASWERVLLEGVAADLWWVWGVEDTRWMVGSGGTVVRFDAATGETSAEVITDPAMTFFGAWGAGPDQIYAVAGDPSGARDGEVHHFDGERWSLVATAPRSPEGGIRGAFKVWGSGPDDVHVVGTGALLMHFNGSEWRHQEPPPVPSATTLFTVHGRGDEAVAVGGLGNAVAVKRVDGTWIDDSPPLTAIAPILVGVNLPVGGGPPIAVGYNGALFRRLDEGWQADPSPPVTTWSYHGVWVDPEGGAWMVGGDLTRLTVGVVAYQGPRRPPSYRP